MSLSRLRLPSDRAPDGSGTRLSKVFVTCVRRVAPWRRAASFIALNKISKGTPMIPATTARVREHTDENINEWIDRQTEESVMYYAAAGPEAIERRLR